MSKAIMISIKPPHMANILNGDKTVEVRKNKALAKATKKMIEEQGYAQFLAYCSKNEYLYRTNKGYFASNKPLRVGKGTEYTFAYSDEGKVVCSFKCYKVEDIFKKSPLHYGTETIWKIKDKCCLTDGQIHDYLKGKNGYAIHINDLKIFDTPKELNRFGTLTNKCNGFRGGLKPLTKAPQNFAYVEMPNDN